MKKKGITLTLTPKETSGGTSTIQGTKKEIAQLLQWVHAEYKWSREREEAKQKEAEQKRLEAEAQAQAEAQARQAEENEAERKRKMTRLQQFRGVKAELDQREKAGAERWQETRLWWQEERKEIERLRKLAKSEYSLRNEREQRLDTLDRLESRFLEEYASQIVYPMIWASRPPAAAELLEMRFRSMKGGRAPDNRRFNAFRDGPDPAKWTKLARRCQIELPEVYFSKAHVAHLLGYSLAGVERLMKRGSIRFERWGHRTVRFWPDDVRKFIKTSAKWRYER